MEKHQLDQGRKTNFNHNMSCESVIILCPQSYDPAFFILTPRNSNSKGSEAWMMRS